MVCTVRHGCVGDTQEHVGVDMHARWRTGVPGIPKSAFDEALGTKSGGQHRVQEQLKGLWNGSQSGQQCPLLHMTH
jgi:hypothetical protein